MKPLNVLPAEVAKVFDCDQTPGPIITKAPHRKHIDLRTISLAEARELHKAGLLPMLKVKVRVAKAAKAVN